MKELKYITLDELLASTKEDFYSYDDMGFFDKARLIKTVMWCNERLGIPIHQTKEKFIKIRDYQGDLPMNFWKVHYVCAVETGSFNISNYRDPFDNTVTEQMKYDAQMTTYVEGCTSKCSPLIIKRSKDIEVKRYSHWTELTLSHSSSKFMDKNCLNRKSGKYTIDITEEKIETPFREGELYILYKSTMEDENGNLLVPFHPLITNWYEWCIKTKVLQDLVFNSDADVSGLLKLAESEKQKSWLDAWNFQMEPEYKQLQRYQHLKEQEFHNKYYNLTL